MISFETRHFLNVSKTRFVRKLFVPKRFVLKNYLI
ncbi:unnamed protein product [Tenebrio molitor]|nr:unnamed protein product [Tenebrio molitor]